MKGGGLRWYGGTSGDRSIRWYGQLERERARSARENFLLLEFTVSLVSIERNKLQLASIMHFQFWSYRNESGAK